MADEIISKREEYSKSFKLENGMISKEIYGYPVHFKDEKGNWVDIDILINNEDNWEFTNSTTGNSYKTYFWDNASSNGHLVGIDIKTATNDSCWINYKLKDANPNELIKDTNVAMFRGCFAEDIDVRYTLIGNVVKEDIILNTYSDLRKFIFTLKMDNMYPEKHENGEVIFYENGTNAQLMVLTKPFMEDANKNYSEGIEYQIGEEDGFISLEVTINDDDFLYNASYPIIIDPTVEVTGLNTNLIMAAQNYGASLSNSAAFMSAQLPGSTSYSSRSYFGIYYNLLDEYKTGMNKIINKAVLSLYCYQLASADNVVVVHNLANQLVSGAYPSSADDAFLTIYPKANQWIDVDFSNQINTRKSTFYGLFFGIAGTYVGGRGAFFRSPFYSDPAYRPKLTLQYIEKPALGFHNGDPNNSGYYSDNSGNIFKYLQFDPMMAGQTSLAKIAYIRNLSGFDVANMQIYVIDSEHPSGVVVRLSETNNPFIETDRIYHNGVVSDNGDVSFYVRISADDTVVSGGDFNIYVKANPVF